MSFDASASVEIGIEGDVQPRISPFDNGAICGMMGL